MSSLRSQTETVHGTNYQNRNGYVEAHFPASWVNAAEELLLRRKLRRKEMVKFFQELPPEKVAIEGCGSSNYWARLLQSIGHEVKLVPPQFVKPCAKRNKNDAADAEALREAMARPTMRFVPVKTAEQQAAIVWSVGFTESPVIKLWRPYVRPFALRFVANHHVCAITRTGFGASGKPFPKAGDYSADRLGEDVLAVMDQLKLERPGLASWLLAGEDGRCVKLWLALGNILGKNWWFSSVNVSRRWK
jgi:hypothetical protein